MKKTISTLFFAAAITISCGKKNSDGPTDTVTDSTITAPVDKTGTDADSLSQEETHADVTVTVKGTVAHVVPGKDGYMAEIKDDAGKTYFATISIPNLNDPKQFRQVKAGDVITVKGESWKMDEELHIKAEELN
jgi:hypothetical protein